MDREYDYEAETDFQHFDQDIDDCDNARDNARDYDKKGVTGFDYGYGIDTESFHLTLNDAYYGNSRQTDTTKKVIISKQMSIYIPDLGLSPKYFKEYTREEINAYFVNYLTRVLCSPYDSVVKKIHKVHVKLNTKTDTISCAVYVEWYNDNKTMVLQKNIRDKKQKVSIKFELDGFEWKLRKNHTPVGDFDYEEKLRSEINRLGMML